MTADVSVADLLYRLPYFAQLSLGRLSALAQKATHHIFQAGQTIFIEGEPSAGLWIIDRGRVKVFRLNAEGREHILHFVWPGDSFNDIVAIDGRSYPANCTALSETKLTNRVRVLVQRVEDLGLHSTTARLAGFLLLQSKNPSLNGPGITRTVIAARLATTPETVSRSLLELEDKGAIQFDRHRIVVVVPDLLQEISLQ
jgi:CRP/FNR family cyclic AMP-dependent transcriptional regulator